jgi:hypothetical protein
MFANMLGMQVIGAIMGAKLTTTALTIVKIDKLSDITGVLCVEEGYDVLTRYVKRQPDRPTSIIFKLREECVTMLQAGEVSAVMTDVTSLTWIASHMQVQGGYVSPVLQANPFSWIYSNYSGNLQQYLDPAVSAATMTDMDWMPFTEALKATYFGLQGGAEPSDENPIHLPSAIAALVLLVFPLFVALLNGDLGPGVFKNAETGWKYRFRKAISQPSAKEDAVFMSDKQGALQGHDLSFFRFAVNQLEEIRGEVTLINKGAGAASELLSLTASPQGKAAPAAKGGPASGDVAALLASMLGPVLQELREVKQQNAVLADAFDALRREQQQSRGGDGGGAGCFGGGAKPAVPPTPSVRLSASQGGVEPPSPSSRRESLMEYSVAVDVAPKL